MPRGRRIPDPKLANWVHDQRQLKRKLDLGKPAAVGANVILAPPCIYPLMILFVCLSRKTSERFFQKFRKTNK